MSSLTGKSSSVGQKVAFISQCLGRIVPPKAHGSIATWTYETARCLSADRPVLLLEYGERSFKTERLCDGGIEVVYLPNAINRIINGLHNRMSEFFARWRTPERQILRPAYSSIFHNFAFVLQAAWQARRWRCDVVHVHNFAQFVPVVRALNPSARIVLHMNCEWLSQLDPQMIARRVEAADAIVGCSGHVVRKILARFPHLKQKCQVVFNGTDVDRFSPVAWRSRSNSREQFRILFVGRISPEKGVHLLVDAFRMVAAKYPNAYLDLVGGVGSLPAEFLVSLSDDPLVRGLAVFYKADYLEDIKGRIPDAIRDRVLFHGNVEHRKLAAHYDNASVFVNPSLSDAFPLTVVEAMAAGLPVVASAVGGVPEAVVHESTGLLVKPNDSGALGSALCRLFEDRQLLGRMAAAARDRAENHFSWRAVANQVTGVYRGEMAGAKTISVGGRSQEHIPA